MQGVEIFVCWDSDKDLSKNDKETQDFIGWTGFKYVTEETNKHIH
jgi:hypothetical protein